MFYWDYPQTLPFAGAILACFYIAQIWKNEKLEDDNNDMNIEDISGVAYSMGI